ncbi:glucosaminidase domain-containing protein [Flavobacterium sp.]|uniref:glucosaminidase domain-containing protein n=1 Tax=Flavobacterium sp. TaxID=239 RepID=UPI00260EEAA5|nr:glucosaminidase domain-containing protein [Flavobacterium sp.]
MIKKIILLCFIGFFIACGSNKSVVRTTKSSAPTKPVVRTVKKPITKPNNPVVKIDSEKSKDSNVKNDESTQILEATTRVKVTTALVLEYIDKYKDIAKKDMKQYGIPASITLGQGILESGAGTGPLSAQANNHFGIKCHKEWTGPSVKYDDDSAQECFRKYNNPDESYRDHSLFLVTRERYSNLFKLEKSDYVGWSKGLKNAGYATDPNYPTKLIGLIERYELHKYDAEVLGVDYVSFVNKSKDNVVNNDAVHQVSKGDTLYSISKRYNISLDDLKKKNNISDNGISIGQKLIIK